MLDALLEMIAAFEKASGLTIKTKLTDRRPGDVEKLVAVPALALELLEWQACLTVEEMCRDAWNWV